MFPVPSGLAAVEQRLLGLFRQLSEQDRATLLSFARYLAQEASALETSEPGPGERWTEPLAIERPRQETVVAAMRRLRATYPMLDKGAMLHETSTLVSAHVLQGRPATQVIDELETLFETRYRAHQGGDER